MNIYRVTTQPDTNSYFAADDIRDVLNYLAANKQLEFVTEIKKIINSVKVLGENHDTQA